MSSTTQTDTVFAAKRMRSTGATRALTIRSLVEAGMGSANAGGAVDEIDLQLGLDGRTLPEDVSDAVRRKVIEHRDAKRATAAQAVPVASDVRPRFESPTPTSGPAATPAAGETSIRTSVPSLAELASGQTPAARPRYETASPAPAETDTGEPAEKKTLTEGEKSSLNYQANSRARNSWSSDRIVAWLVGEGMTAQEAQVATHNAFRKVQLERQRSASAAQGGGDSAMAWLEIAGGVALLIGGLAAGWFIGLGLFIIIDGFRRLGS